MKDIRYDILIQKSQKHTLRNNEGNYLRPMVLIAVNPPRALCELSIRRLFLFVVKFTEICSFEIID